jgi:hypothetical protein
MIRFADRFTKWKAIAGKLSKELSKWRRDESQSLPDMASYQNLSIITMAVVRPKVHIIN